MKKNGGTGKILQAYKKIGGRIETKGRVQLKTKKDFALFYTPGVGKVSEYLAKYPKEARTYSIKNNSVAVVSDGSAVLGLGNIGPYGALPVMEGKALIFKQLAGIDAWPIVLTTQDPDEIVETVLRIAPAFGGINLEDIAAPHCFEIERKLIEKLDIPVMHDDQHGTAIVVLAGLINAAKVVRKTFTKLRVVILGAGAAGLSTGRLLLASGVRDVVIVDRLGILSRRRNNLTAEKVELAKLSNPRGLDGTLDDALSGADVCIGVSGPGLLSKEQIGHMAAKPIIFALSNPIPEIMPEEAFAAGAEVVATGRSDFPNQINNALVFPGVFRGALDHGVRKITEQVKLRAAMALAKLVPHPAKNRIIPDILDTKVVRTVAKAIR